MALFQKNIEPRCSYCARSRPLDADQVVCDKKGVMSGASHCRAFRYDPLKRVPPAPPRRISADSKTRTFSCNQQKQPPSWAAVFSACKKTSVEMNPLKLGRGSSGGGSPPRVGSNALNALLDKAFSERSEDFSAAQRWESIGILSDCRKSPKTFPTA